MKNISLKYLIKYLKIFQTLIYLIGTIILKLIKYANLVQDPKSYPKLVYNEELVH